PEGQTVRFEADRTPGRARLQFSRAIGSAGIPTGALANLQVRGVSPGTTLFRVSAGAASGASGAAPPVTETTSLTVRN
ncbi:MAG: hypothetical protein ABIT01_10250, partial [Thermoanaerobaculia bacterium]